MTMLLLLLLLLLLVVARKKQREEVGGPQKENVGFWFLVCHDQKPTDTFPKSNDQKNTGSLPI